MLFFKNEIPHGEIRESEARDKMDCVNNGLEAYAEIYIAPAQLQDMIEVFFKKIGKQEPAELLADQTFENFVGAWVAKNVSLPDGSTRISFTKALQARAVALMQSYVDMPGVYRSSQSWSDYYYILAAVSTPLRAYINSGHPLFDIKEFMAQAADIKNSVTTINS